MWVGRALYGHRLLSVGNWALITMPLTNELIQVVLPLQADGAFVGALWVHKWETQNIPGASPPPPDNGFAQRLSS